MKYLLHILLSTIITFLCFTPSNCQLESHDRIEKGYIQTDKPLYMPGDEIWIKAWVVNGANMPTLLSQKASLELIKPDGSKLLNKEILIEDGAITEYIKLKSDIKGGIYQLKLKTLWMSSLNSGYEYSKDIIIQKYDPPRLLMKIDLDKESYGMGETVNANFDVKDLKDRPIPNINVSYTLYIEGIESKKRYGSTDENGKSSVVIPLPSDIKTSNVSINAKIEYRAQIESISKRIPIVLENIDLQFLPEGGSLLNDFQNVLAFKALTEKGEPADVSGEIVNSKGQKITTFESIHDGMGKAYLTPKTNESYFAKICSPYESKTLIPITFQTSDIAKISVEAQTKENIHLQILGNHKEEMQLVVANMHKEIWCTSLKLESDLKNLQIPTSNLSQGIYKISLKHKDSILSERLIFLHPERGMNVAIDLDKKVYGLREKVVAKIKTTDYKGNPISGDLGISVVENKMLSFADDKQAYLTTELLLSSELKGEIHEPNYYFDSITVETKTHLDLVMLTHGWRTYLEGANDDEAFNYLINQNTHIGQVISRNGKHGLNTQVVIQEYNSENIRIVDTDEEGFFMLPFHTDKSFKIIAKARYKDAYLMSWDLKDLMKVQPEKVNRLKKKWLTKPQFLVHDPPPSEMKERFIDYDAEFVTDLEEGVLMDAIEIVEYKAPLIEIDNTTSGATVTGESIRSLPTKSINAIAATTAGISVADGGPLSIRGSRSKATIYYTDGIRVSGLIPQRFNEEEEINVLTRTYNKTYTSNSNLPLITRNMNYRVARSNNRQFYVPQYKKSNAKVRSDFRKTIYWNPRVQTNSNGDAQISFYTSDEVTSFSLIAEGITAEGEIGRKVEELVAVKSLNIDCKLPSYFVLGDTAEISLVINNDGEEDQHVNIEIIAPHLYIHDSGIQSVFVKKGESFSFPFKAIPLNEIEQSDILISAKSEKYTDFISKDIAILNPYFPMHYSYSGVDSDTFTIEIYSPIDNSLEAQFRTYNPVSTALEGIESILRRPSGCFEQVSSSTYPNVMVYQYLKNNQTTNKEPMLKAMEYIEEGYKKLVGYETTEDGFEWFGNTPANVALTAYGLLEFSDMAKVYNGVDSEMLKRTINFLMSKKDGKGGFLNQKGLDGFGTVLYDVQTAYVLYALSNQNLIKVDIDREYNSAKKHALKTKDSYLLALMALTANNLGLTNDYNNYKDLILSILNQNKLDKVMCANTITRSGNNDKNIETLSLIAMALMRAEDENKPMVSKIIDHLINSRSGGRFGSTQATCLAIQAILRYADWNPKSTIHPESTISAIIDNQFITTIDKSFDATEFITQNSHNIEVHYNGPSQKSYEMSISYLSKIPESPSDPELRLTTELVQGECSVADQVSMKVELINLKDKVSANPTIILGIPSGMSIQMSQLKELKKDGQINYFEIFENKLVLYFNEMASLAKKSLLLDLKADIAGKFTAPPSCAYPYYDDQNCSWVKGVKVKIDNRSKLELN